MKLLGSTGALCSLHTSLVTEQTGGGLILPAGRRPNSGQWTAGGKCSPWEVLELGTMREGGVCQGAGTMLARLVSGWGGATSQNSLGVQTFLSVLVFLRAFPPP